MRRAIGIEPDYENTFDTNISATIAQAAQSACLLEVAAPKPGNVRPGAAFADTCFEDFIISAAAIGPAFNGTGHCSVGRIIWKAINATRRMVRSNTNLGMVLLLVPLAKACLYGLNSTSNRSGETPQALPGLKKLRKNLGKVLSALTVEDAHWAYRAIRLACPGGLGRVKDGDISEEPSITLYRAMEMAGDKDAIAREYVTNYEITFRLSYPSLKEALRRTSTISTAIVQAYLTVLSEVPDTLIARKKGIDKAREVSSWAKEVLSAGGVFTEPGRKRIEVLDSLIRKEGNALNPGTTADLVTAAIFLYLLYDR